MGLLDGKTAIITGSSSGIGKKTAEIFASQGAAVVLTARREERLKQVKEEIEAAGGKAFIIQADVADIQDCRRIVSETIDLFGKIDILVNNAGIDDRMKPITRCDDENWERVMKVDLDSVFYITRPALIQMEKQGYGSVVNISSIGGTRAIAGISYSAAKAAVIAMTKNIALQYAGTSIRCNAVCPGPTPTEIFLKENQDKSDKAFGAVTASHFCPDLSHAEPEDQANACLFFASDMSKQVTGQILTVDSGATL